MKLPVALVAAVFTSAAASAAPLTCDLGQYTAKDGLTATIESDVLSVAWAGDNGSDLRMRFVIQDGQPIVRELAIRRQGGAWATLGQDLTPEYHVTSGVRRLSYQQSGPLEGTGVDIDQAVIDREKWYVFWDAPLLVPGVTEGRNPRNWGLPRSPDEIRHMDASFNTSSCSVKTDGARLEVTFPGLSMGIFAGDLRFTVYRDTNLVRMEAIAKTEEDSVAYIYEGGLSGFSTGTLSRVAWNDLGGNPQQYMFGGVTNDTRVAVRAANRVLVAEGQGGSVAAFPPPHAFFWTREVDINLGYVWYRHDEGDQFGIGVRQHDREEDPRYVENFALYNAPPGTMQRMAMYFYAGTGPAEATRQDVLAFTYGDKFKAVPGYQTFVNHFHLRFTERQRALGSLDYKFPDLEAMKAVGLNIVGLSDFHGDMNPNDPGPLRFQDWRDYGLASQKASDADFLVTPWEEPSAYFGGHFNTMFPKLVYWSKVREPGQPYTEQDPTYGTVYHVGNTDDMQQLLDDEDGYWFHAHPRTKGTTGYPDHLFDTSYLRNDRYLGVAFKPGMGQDLSEQRMCEYRCFDAVDTMNNLLAGTGLRPKYIIADVDTYQKGPNDDIYANFPVNYVKLDRLPRADEDWSPILTALRNGDFFVTTGEVLISNFAVGGSGDSRTVGADVQWTYPLEFVEVVWGDGATIDRQIISATDLPPMGSKRFEIPFDATGKAWVRLAVWDSAGNGAFVQPVWVNPSAVTSGSAVR